ncbi:MAG: hypothetical protein ABDH49_01890 [Candidatus Hydrothermales bacterium]
MKHSIIVGLTFGMTSGIITTMGLMIGLFSGTSSRLAVIGGILTVAIADAFSDALGIHISEESENVHSTKEIWISTISTFLAKLFFASTFIVPVILFKINIAIIVNILWGFLVLGFASYILARAQSENPLKVISEHLIIAIVVILLSHFVGVLISNFFN